jgi:large subunit ribosomal protein L3
MIGLLAKKVGMTQLFGEKGDVRPVTLLETGPCYVIQKKNQKSDGYDAIQIGYEPKKKSNRPLAGHFKKANLPVLRELKEIRVKNVEEYQVGQELKVDIFAAGDWVDVVGFTRGRGFAGGMKRWGWVGGPATHGSMSHRRIGSVGCTTSPGRVLRGKHLPGHYGDEQVTVKNLKVVRVDGAKNLLFVSGAVPGPRNGILFIRKKQ